MQKIIYSTISFGLLVTVILYFEFNDVGSSEVDSQTSEIDRGADGVVSTQEAQLDPATQATDLPASVDSLDQDIQFTAAEIVEMNDWLSSHGFTMLFDKDGNRHAYSFEEAERSSYDYYDLETLMGLAEVDQYARLALGLRLYDKRKFEEAEPFLRKSAVDGFARPLLRLYDLHVKEGKKLKKSNLNPDESFVEAYAWQHVFNLRFFPNSLLFEDKWDLRIDQDRLDEIKIAARLRGSQIYSDLVSARENLGLAEFDNYVPRSFQLLASTRN